MAAPDSASLHPGYDPDGAVGVYRRDAKEKRLLTAEARRHRERIVLLYLWLYLGYGRSGFSREQLLANTKLISRLKSLLHINNDLCASAVNQAMNFAYFASFAAIARNPASDLIVTLNKIL
jgi:hypothetical protein